jgi:NAD(P)-dependent dehydrogenase (short-subunit alcohol dehydrogenase family)
MKSLSGKAVVVTGAARGIGAAYSLYFAREGASVVVNDIDSAEAEALAVSIRADDKARAAGGTAAVHACDITSFDAARGLVDFCVKQFGKLDGFVNNAGIYHLASPGDETEQRFRRLMEVNVMGTAWCGLHALRQMKRQGHGSLVNTTSGSQMGMPGGAAYGGSKGAAASMTYAWALDMKDTGVRVNAISPMATTRMTGTTDEYTRSRGGDPSGRVSIDPAHNAPLVAFLLSDCSREVTGQVIRVQGAEISIMSHPAVLLPSARRDSWSVEDVRDAFAADLTKRAFPLGPAALEATVKPYGVPYKNK